MHECGASDGYFNTDQGESEFVGFQVTRATVQPDKTFQMCTIHKSKDFLVHQVCELGFIFFAFLYVMDQCRGILLLTPHDEALIRSLPTCALIVCGIKEKAQAVLLNRELKPVKPAAKVPKLLKTPVILPARSQSGPINMTGRQQIATLNGPNSEIPRWTPFVTGGSLCFPTFFEKPGSAAADNKYKGVLALQL